MVSAHVTPCILVYSYRLEQNSVHNKGGGESMDKLWLRDNMSSHPVSTRRHSNRYVTLKPYRIKSPLTSTMQKPVYIQQNLLEDQTALLLLVR
jgi:hypothetical protein